MSVQPIDLPTDRGLQRRLFVRSEGDAYYARNHAGPWGGGANTGVDPPLRVLRRLRLAPRAVLEIGCSDGWRVGALAQHPEVELAAGVDPSAVALRAGRNRYARTRFTRTTAEALPFRAGSFDLVVLGFFLYVADRADLFRIAAECDRVLRDGGHVLLYDFHSDRPARVAYHHADGCHTFKMDYRRMFLWNPAYRCIYHEVLGESPALGTGDSRRVVSVLRRQERGAYAEAERGQ